MLGGAATYNEPAYHIVPSGNIKWSAKTELSVKTPELLTAPNRTTRCVFVCSCLGPLSFDPDESATYSRPCSSKSATIGRSTFGGPATFSTVNPSGSLNVRPSMCTSPPLTGQTQTLQHPVRIKTNLTGAQQNTRDGIFM